MTEPNIVYLCLGSNLEDREQNLLTAIRKLSTGVHVEQLSSLYETEPVGFSEQPWFLNACCRASTTLEPFSLLAFVKEIEASMGRAPSFANAPRAIDIDIIFYGDLVIKTPELVIPHPRYAERAFVLVPLVEIASGFVCPQRGIALERLCSELKSTSRVLKSAWKQKTF